VHARLKIEKFRVFLRELVFCFFFVGFVVENTGDRVEGSGYRGGSSGCRIQDARCRLKAAGTPYQLLIGSCDQVAG